MVNLLVSRSSLINSMLLVLSIASADEQGPFGEIHWQQSMNSGCKVDTKSLAEFTQHGTQCQLSMNKPLLQVKQSLARGPEQVEQEE